MKKIVVLLAVLVFGLHAVTAQENVNVEEKEFTFVYVAHTTDVPLAKLVSILEEHYRNGVQFSNDVIFYLSNGVEPLVVKVNTKDDNKLDFEKIVIDELWSKRSHEIDPYADIESIITLLNETDFLREDGRLKYSSVVFDFFVSETFWTMKYNESIIAKLYFLLDINSIRKINPELIFNVHYPSESNMQFEKDKPFGLKNLGKINNNVILLPY